MLLFYLNINCAHTKTIPKYHLLYRSTSSFMTSNVETKFSTVIRVQAISNRRRHKANTIKDIRPQRLAHKHSLSNSQPDTPWNLNVNTNLGKFQSIQL